MKKRRIKKSVYFVLGIIIFIIISIVGLINYIKYINSNKYKLDKIGYSSDEINIILKQDDASIKDILTRDYNKNIVSFMKQKYFMYKNLDRYLSYQKENKKQKLSHIVSLVNVHADNEWYDEDSIVQTDLSKGNLILVNKFYHLNEDYTPESIIEARNTYAYAENSATEETIEAFKNMWKKAKEQDLSLIINSSYRSYSSQEKIWDRYEMNYGEEWADSYAARAGHSEHQTGLALDITTYNSTMNDFEETEECKWLKENAYKYGFILRYPKDKEDITGYAYESWHYRYVGKELAEKIYKENITFDEYYAYYLEK